MIPVVSVVGRSNSGKTTLIEKMIGELIRRGYRVATIKHNRHGFEIDHERKDSWRHKQAGARTTVIASPGRVAIVEDVDKDMDIGELVDRYIRDVDIVLSEGFKKNTFPKIEVNRSEMNQGLLCSPVDNLIAVCSDRPLTAGVLCLDINDIGGLIDLVETRFLKSRTLHNR
ncbi:MAG: molybdopterin-guanine dinucleotide biosynthesis protein B [Syntrophus sp. (in: bacteria)]|nr:molybdopterin-guanine dinucleotide biosynthesis protein B [Syntrophus sp. (in: bacteria)]